MGLTVGRARFIAYMFCLFALLCTAPLSAGEMLLTLSGIVKRVLADNPFTREAELRIRTAELELARVRHKILLPTLDLNIQMGIVPEDDQSFLDGLGPFARFEVRAVQPLYTFGKVSNGKELASLGVDIARVKAKIATEKLVLQAARAFWLLSSARRSESIAAKLRKDYQKLLDEVETNSKKKDSDITAVDLLNVKTSHYSIESLFVASREGVSRIEGALRVLLRLKDGTTLQAEDQSLPEFSTNQVSLARVLDYGQKHRPELRALDFGAQAARVSLNLARSMMMPDLFVGAGAKWRWADKRPSDDDYNERGLGAFLGLSWKLGFWRSQDDIKSARLKMKTLEEKGRMLRDNVSIEIRQAYARMIREQETLDAVRKSLKYSKTWHRLAGDNWEMGLGSVGDFIKAYREYYQLEGALIRQEMAYANALIQLAHVMGDTKLVLRWFKNEKIVF